MDAPMVLAIVRDGVINLWVALIYRRQAHGAIAVPCLYAPAISKRKMRLALCMAPPP